MSPGFVFQNGTLHNCESRIYWQASRCMAPRCLTSNSRYGVAESLIIYTAYKYCFHIVSEVSIPHLTDEKVKPPPLISIKLVSSPSPPSLRDSLPHDTCASWPDSSYYMVQSSRSISGICQIEDGIGIATPIILAALAGVELATASYRYLNLTSLTRKTQFLLK
jgi:hypothetical protein